MLYARLFPVMENFDICPQNCSGRGECHLGKCFCEIAYDGGSCRDTNLRYAVPFGAVFYVICLTSIIQLILCIKEDFKVQGRKSILRPTTQKLLYFFVIIATGSRGLYFSLKDHISEPWSENLFVCYYPLLLSLFSLIICYWAEAFHLDLSAKPKFLTKSVIGFATFNVLVYSVLFLQFISTKITSKNEKIHVQEIFNGCFAFMMLLVLLFFLIYGVEIFCKVEGAFSTDASGKQVNLSQLAQSRLGLIVQAGFQLAVILSLLGDVIGKVWKHRMSQRDKNMLEITFRVFELAIAVWFPCVLWNVYRPDELWILNPKKLLKFRASRGESTRLLDEQVTRYRSFHSVSSVSVDAECYFCNDPTKAGPLIHPCSCNGVVHHDCIKKWLVKDQSNTKGKEPLKCKVCLTQYHIVERHTSIVKGCGLRTALQTAGLVVWMIGSPIGAWIVWLKLGNNIARLLIVGGVVLLEWFLIKLFAVNLNSAKRKARLTSIRILDRSKHTTRVHASSSVSSQDSISTGESCLQANMIETL